MKVLGLIPARAGSKSIPRKNLAELGGKPLISWTIDAASKSSLTRTVVSTECEEIAGVCRNLGAEVPFLRPKSLASDDSRSIDVVNHAIESLNEKFDAVMLLQPTSPFRTFEDINDALLMKSDASSVISVVPVEGTHPARMKFIEEGFLIDPPFGEEFENMPRQNLRPMYIRNGAIYLTGINEIYRETFKGDKSRALIMPKERSINIDSLFDLQLARAMLKEGLI